MIPSLVWDGLPAGILPDQDGSGVAFYAIRPISGFRPQPYEM